MSTEHGVCFELRLLHNAIKRRLQAAAPLPCEGATHLHGMIVSFIAGHQGQDLFQRDLENEFHIRRSTASTVLKLMEKNGLLYRESVPQDARLKRLVLTEQAYSLHEQINQRMEEIDQELAQGISQEELDLFVRVIRQMRDNMELLETPTPENGGKELL